MRVYIIGPTGSGKTYLAKKLSEKLKIKHTKLDYVFFSHIVDKNRIELPEKEWKRKLGNTVRRKSWIIEGINPIKDVFEVADKIIYLRPTLWYSLHGQWRRYITDPLQRKEHGFINNIKLSKYLVRQYLENFDTNRIDDPKYSRIRKTDEIVRGYQKKVIKLSSRKEVDNFIKNPKLLFN